MELTKEEIKKVCLDRLRRELSEKGKHDRFELYLAGYNEAINDLLWDLFKARPIGINQQEENSKAK